MSVLHLDAKNFDEVVSSNEVVVVDFSAAWCGPCKMMAPVMEQASKTFDGKAVIGKIDVDDASQVAQKFGVMSIPTVVVLKNGVEVDRQVGFSASGDFEDFLKPHM